MANTVVLSRAHIVFGLCLPLAILIGYLLAQPFESSSMAAVTFVIGILSIPVLMRWHHSILIFSCNTTLFPLFIPGHPTLWMLTAFISMFFLVLDRSLGQKVDFFKARQVSYSLIFLGVLLLATAYLNGGMQFEAIGSSNGGGKRYAYVFAAIMAFFCLSAVPTSRKNVNTVLALFFLSALTGFIGYLAVMAIPGSDLVSTLFSVEGTTEFEHAASDITGNSFARYGGLGVAGMGLVWYLMARYGLRGLFELSKPWRMGFMALALIGILFSGFRSGLILFAMVFFALFYMEGLVRTRYFAILCTLAILCASFTLPFVQKLPLPVQRSLCFLPVNVDPVVIADAEDSTNWRLQMWQELLSTVPKYLIKGKGYSISLNDLQMAQQSRMMGYGKSYDEAIISGDYHSGPLSLIIPMGIFGVIGFLWFLTVSVGVLRRNYRYGDPEIKIINRFLLAFFITRIFFFFLIFGSFFSDLIVFTTLVGLSISLNNGVRSRQETVNLSNHAFVPIN